MIEKKQLIILISAGVLIFLIAGALGFVLGMPHGPQKAKIETATNLSSKVISSMVAYGQVKNIDGRNITLNNLGDDLTISISNTAQVYSFSVPEGATAPVQKTIKFEDIKVGDKINATIKTLPNGQLEGESVIILPVAQ